MTDALTSCTIIAQLDTVVCYATAIMSPSIHSEFVTSDKATLSRG